MGSTGAPGSKLLRLQKARDHTNRLRSWGFQSSPPSSGVASGFPTSHSHRSEALLATCSSTFLTSCLRSRSTSSSAALPDRRLRVPLATAQARLARSAPPKASAASPRPTRRRRERSRMRDEGWPRSARAQRIEARSREEKAGRQGKWREGVSGKGVDCRGTWESKTSAALSSGSFCWASSSAIEARIAVASRTRVSPSSRSSSFASTSSVGINEIVSSVRDMDGAVGTFTIDTTLSMSGSESIF
mmetsp:Transcript_32902/g.75749  ORF Transcript_32902/g.75749 Transcript_32902/m.75749 type:complete len:245 (-) Transcript_32902:732-1466(-)